MNISKVVVLTWAYYCTIQLVFGQQADTTMRNPVQFTGSVGITNNGFSIVPTFSLNSPAAILNVAWRKKRLSFEPDIRLVPNASKGSMIFWLRYRVIENEKFTLRVGVHPAFSLVRRKVIDNGVSSEITEVLRFAAAEIVPTYRITPHWSIGAMYLHGSGLQRHGPQNTNVLFLNTAVSDIPLVGHFRLTLLPTVFFLNVDGRRGSYFSGTVVFSRKNLPFTVQSTINQTFRSTIAGNQNFMWNVMVSYHMRRTFQRTPPENG